MINWFNIPDEGLSNGGLFEVKELEVTENGTYETKGEMYNKVTVNVEGGGGGGSSDFSTAEVTLMGESVAGDVYLAIATEEEGMSAAFSRANYIQNNPQTYRAILYKNSGIGALVKATHQISNISGNAQNMGNGFFLFTGDCTITIK